MTEGESLFGEQKGEEALELVDIIRWLSKEKTKLVREQRGFTLLETLIALGILGFIGVAFIYALYTSSMSTDTYTEHVTAQSLAQSRLEEIKTFPYLTEGNYDEVYLITFAVPTGYGVTTNAVEQAVGKQEITVTVSRDGDNVLQVTTIKSDW